MDVDVSSAVDVVVVVVVVVVVSLLLLLLTRLVRPKPNNKLLDALLLLLLMLLACPQSETSKRVARRNRHFMLAVVSFWDVEYLIPAGLAFLAKRVATRSVVAVTLYGWTSCCG